MAILVTGSDAGVHAEGMERLPDPEVAEKPRRRRFTAETSSASWRRPTGRLSLGRARPCCGVRACIPRI